MVKEVEKKGREGREGGRKEGQMEVLGALGQEQYPLSDRGEGRVSHEQSLWRQACFLKGEGRRPDEPGFLIFLNLISGLWDSV